jgi:hypothetical protein
MEHYIMDEQAIQTIIEPWLIKGLRWLLSAGLAWLVAYAACHNVDLNAALGAATVVGITQVVAPPLAIVIAHLLEMALTKWAPSLAATKEPDRLRRCGPMPPAYGSPQGSASR